MSPQADDTYTLGRTAEEERRLQRQAALFEPFTRRLFTAARIGPGLKVLDLGTGAGDVALLAAEVVGPGGSVVGIDLNPVILETARRRALAAGYPNVTFLEGGYPDCGGRCRLRRAGRARDHLPCARTGRDPPAFPPLRAPGRRRRLQ